MKNLKLKDLNKKKKQIGFIFNTDPHYKSGQHWISLFVDIYFEERTYYFETYHSVAYYLFVVAVVQ